MLIKHFPFQNFYSDLVSLMQLKLVIAGIKAFWYTNISSSICSKKYLWPNTIFNKIFDINILFRRFIKKEVYKKRGLKIGGLKIGGLKKGGFKIGGKKYKF